MNDELFGSRGPVWAAIDAARQRLRFSLDLDMSDVTLFDLMEQPLGDTPNCLSATEVADFVAGRWPSGSPEIERREVHVATCPSCRDSIHIFRQVTLEHFTLAIANTIDVPAAGSSPLNVLVANYGNVPIVHEIDPSSIVIQSTPLFATGAEIYPIEPPKHAIEAMRIACSTYRFDLPKGQEIQDVVQLDARMRNGEPLYARQMVRIYSM